MPKRSIHSLKRRRIKQSLFGAWVKRSSCSARLMSPFLSVSGANIADAMYIGAQQPEEEREKELYELEHMHDHENE